MLGKVHRDLTIENRGLRVAQDARLTEPRHHHPVDRHQRDASAPIARRSLRRKHGHLQVPPSPRQARRSGAFRQR
jgi:hypothetical protein